MFDIYLGDSERNERKAAVTVVVCYWVAGCSFSKVCRAHLHQQRVLPHVSPTRHAKNSSTHLKTNAVPFVANNRPDAGTPHVSVPAVFHCQQRTKQATAVP